MSDFLHQQLEQLSSRTLSIGVTGFARAGKTVFLASVVQALLTAAAWSTRRGQGQLVGFGPFERRVFRSVRIRDDIRATLPQFQFRKVRESLLGGDAEWPEPTLGLSHLVLDVHFEPAGRFRRFKRNHLLINLVDYPGEWLVDVPMLKQTYADWSEEMWRLANSGSRVGLSEAFRTEVMALSGAGHVEEDTVSRLAEKWSHYLAAAADIGLVMNQPGRMLRPDALRDSPILRFFPLPPDLDNPLLHDRLEKRFDQYVRDVVRPFFRNHFSKIDRQIVLVDILRSIELGEEAFGEMEGALGNTLSAFNYSKGGPLDWIVGARTTKVLFAATKADHVVRGDRAILENTLREILARVAYNLPGQVTKVDVKALASIRATQDYITRQPPQREILFGKPAGQAEMGQWDPGGLPLDVPPNWPMVHFQFLRFEPPVVQNALLEGFPNLNLGKALDFLIGEDIA